MAFIKEDGIISLFIEEEVDKSLVVVTVMYCGKTEQTCSSLEMRPKTKRVDYDCHIYKDVT